jgi:hypothetical protein
LKVNDPMLMIGNWPADHRLAKRRCEMIADAIKFIIMYELYHDGKLIRERDELRRLMYPFTCDSAETGKDRVKYSPHHHYHTKAAYAVMSKHPKSHLQKYLRHEHMIPRSIVEKKLFENRDCQLGCSGAVADVLSQCLRVAIITVDEDRLLKEHGLNQKMPSDWNGVNPFARYKVAGIELCDPQAYNKD